MTPFVTMRRALSDKHLLGAALGGDSWLAWRILLIAAMGEALTEEERAIFAKLTGREREPGERVDELWCVIGRRGGKSRAIAALLVYLATMVDYCSQLVSGERVVVLCLTRTQEQSQVVLEYVAGVIEAAPILAKMVIRRAADSLTLFNRGATIVIAVRAASFRSVRGLTCVAAVADEIVLASRRWFSQSGCRNRARGQADVADHPVCGALVTLERDRRPQLISVVDVVGVDGPPPPLPRSQYVFAAVWASGADIAVVYGASSHWSDELFVADFDAVLYHGGFFANLATRLGELAKACRAYGCFVAAPGALIRHIEAHGSWSSKSRPASIRPTCFSPPVHQERADQVLPADDRQDGDTPLGRGVELQGR